MLHPPLSIVRAMTAGLKNMIEADKITFNIGIGIGDAVAYTSLCRKVDIYV